jgi:hypothetical protein
MFSCLFLGSNYVVTMTQHQDKTHAHPLSTHATPKPLPRATARGVVEGGDDRRHGQHPTTDTSANARRGCKRKRKRKHQCQHQTPAPTPTPDVSANANGRRSANARRARQCRRQTPIPMPDANANTSRHTNAKHQCHQHLMTSTMPTEAPLAPNVRGFFYFLIFCAS